MLQDICRCPPRRRGRVAEPHVFCDGVFLRKKTTTKNMSVTHSVGVCLQLVDPHNSSLQTSLAVSLVTWTTHLYPPLVSTFIVF